MNEFDDNTEEIVDEIAIIGMAGRFPGARNVDEFWQNLSNGVEAISWFSDEELAENFSPEVWQSPNYVKAGFVLEDIDQFDAAFFQMSPRQAQVTDPQQRIFLETAWTALEHAGLDVTSYEGLIGVYAGSTMSTYYLYKVQDNLESDMSVWVGNDKDYLTTQTAYQLNLQGPSVNVQTACSTGLVAVHLACQSLLNHECDVALAGGVNVKVPHKNGYFYQVNGILSPDGHCRAFDAKSEGTIFGNGLGVVVLKRLGEALEDGDNILAVVKGWAINNDGSQKVGFTAPSLDGQAKVITEALTVAQVAPETITYVETHGTGTPLGDPIEITALTQAFRTNSTHTNGPPSQYCGIGSLKTNIGHLESAAGIASFIKTVLALQHKSLPPSLYFEEPNPEIDFANSPFYVNAELSDWPRNGHPRRAGVSSFGIGGTNAHVILEEAPERSPGSPSRPWQLLLLSAKNTSALDDATMNLAEYLRTALTPGPSPNNGRGQIPSREIELADVAYTLQVGRQDFKHRRMLVVPNSEPSPESLSETITALQTIDPARLLSGQVGNKERGVVFMFPGGGTQYINMALGLYQTEALFKEVVDHCAELLRPVLGLDLRDLLYPTPDNSAAATDFLNQMGYMLPALFVVEYALARLWMSWGVEPQAMIGHSIGEYIAACVAGVFSLEDALKIVALRGRLMQETEDGRMMAVSLSERELAPLLRPGVSLGVINSPNQCVVSGEIEAVEQLEQQLRAQEVDCRILRISCASHSLLMEPALPALIKKLREMSLQPPQIPFISNVTGTWMTEAEAVDPLYWARHLCQTVRFADGLQEIMAKPEWALLEVGPGRTLSGLVKRQSNELPSQPVLTSLPAAATADSPKFTLAQQPALPHLLTTLGRLWLAGVSIDWAGFYNEETRHRVALPTYAFQRQRYWVEGKRQVGERQSAPELDDSLPSPLEKWFHVPSWKRAVTPKVAHLAEPQNWLLFVHEAGIGEHLVTHLQAASPKLTLAPQVVVAVTAGAGFARLADNRYTINPQAKEDYEALFKALASEEKLPQRIYHLWSVDTAPEADDTTFDNDVPKGHDMFERADQARIFAFDSLLYLVQALKAEVPTNMEQKTTLAIVTSQLYEVTGSERLVPEQALVVGPCRVIPLEYPDVTCLHIDLPDLIGLSPRQIEPLITRLVAEVTDPREEKNKESARETPTIAYRGFSRWVQSYEPSDLVLPSPETKQTVQLPSLLRKNGTYLIIGGLGGVGLTLAEYLAQTTQANLILTSRSGLGGGSTEVVEVSDEKKEEKRDKIEAVRRLEALGSQVLVVQADVADWKQMEAAITTSKQRFGHIHGVIHSAAVVGGGIIALKTEDSVTEILRPKVQGTLVLDRLLQETPPDFMVYCSSLTSVIGVPGQVDYCAANAFQDAFAHYRSHHPTNPYPVISINWDVWLEVGRAVEEAKPVAERAAKRKGVGDVGAKLASAQGSRKRRPVNYPLFDECIVEAPNRWVYVSLLSATDWVLDEHRIMGQATFPGTGYLELARAAFADYVQAEHLQSVAEVPQGGVSVPMLIQDVSILQGLVVADAEREVREVHTILTEQESGEEVYFSVVSYSQTGESLEHAQGVLTRLDDGRTKNHDLQALAAACPRDMTQADMVSDSVIKSGNESAPQEPPLKKGPRFNTIKTLKLGDHQGLTYLELPAQFAPDLASYLLHPGLMDIATAFLTPTVTSEALPIGYQSLKISAPLAREIYCYAQNTGDGQGNILTFDITIMNKSGQELVSIKDFMLMQTSFSTLLKNNEATRPASRNQALDNADEADETPPPQNWGGLRGGGAQAATHGIRPQEGATALSHILRAQLPHHPLPQVVVSTLNLSTQRKLTRQLEEAEVNSESDSSTEHYARPALGTAYVAPTTESEQLIAQLWQEGLGIKQIGIHDDFFELGGHSLLATHLLATLGKQVGQKIPLATLFQAPTIAELAAHLITKQKNVESKGTSQLSPAVVPMQVNGDRPALFCLPGSGGFVLYLWELVRELGSEQPFYGLQPPGLEDDDTPPLNRMDDITDYLINALQQVQPTGPYLLGGHSAGGHIAFALALALQERGMEVPFVVLFDAASYDDIKERMRSFGEQMGEEILADLRGYVVGLKTRLEGLKTRLGDRLSLSTSDIQALDEQDEESLSIVTEAYKELNFLPDDGGMQHIKRGEALQQATLEALEHYEPDSIYHGQLLILKAGNSEFFNEEPEKMIAGWQAHCSKPVQLQTVPGNHLTILMSPNVELMARHLQAALDDLLGLAF